MKTNSKLKMQNAKLNSAGFTLIELLSSVIVLVAVTSVIAGIITSSLRGTNKTTTLENIRQIGNYTLAQMSKNIEYAQVFNGVSDNDTDYVTSCLFSNLSTPIAVTTPYDYLKVTPLDGIPITYNCAPNKLRPTPTPQPLVFTVDDGTGPMPLIDTNVVSLNSCAIACIQTKSADVPIIKIEFTLEPKTSNNLVENNTPPITFETSVIIRNYKK